jgi:hypothetical protein
MTPENVIEQWANYFNNADTKNILSLYHTSATLLPTFLPKLLTSNNEIKGYFEVAFNGDASVEVNVENAIIKELPENNFLITGDYIFCLGSKEDKKYLSWYSFLIDLSSDSPIRHHHSSRVPFEFDLSNTE